MKLIIAMLLVCTTSFGCYRPFALLADETYQCDCYYDYDEPEYASYGDDQEEYEEIDEYQEDNDDWNTDSFEGDLRGSEDSPAFDS